MKIGIITTHYALNFGAVLQSYALQQYLLSKGFECEIIDFRPNIDKYGRKYVVWNKKPKQIIQNIIKIIDKKERERFDEKIEKFDNFLSNELVLSRKIYKEAKDFDSLEAYDAFICGSDQIWNLNLFDIPEFFLPFKKRFPNALYISYAASVAEELCEDKWCVINQRTQHFDNISFREENAALTFRNLGRKAEVVLDPVFLLSAQQWDKEAGREHFSKKEYILCYFIGHRGFELELIEKVKREMGIDFVVNIGIDPTNHIKANMQCENISPRDFLAAIRDAEYIVTNSFHMTALSIIFKKNFYIVEHLTRNSRMNNLVESLNLQGRFIHDVPDVKNANKNEMICDYEFVESNLKRQIEMSKQYLDKSLIDART